MTETAIAPRTLSDVHRAYLNEHAVSDEIIEAQGIRSDGNDIVFTWTEGEHVTEQRRPWPGAGGQYYWTKDADLHLNVLRDPGPDAVILLCEGTKQSLAVASWAPPEYAVMGMPGCHGWTMSRKLDLARFAGRQMLIMLDADAGDNLDVWDAGMRLASELAMEDPPASALFIPSPSWGKDGIDDYLGRIAPERRADRLAKLITRAQDKPADKKPTKRKVPEKVPETGDRPMIIINRDRRDVIHEILNALRQKWDGRNLFCFGGALTRLRDTSTEPLDRDAFLRWLPEAVACFRYKEATMMSPARYDPDWPDPPTIGALLASADEFAPLQRVARVPFIRPDGTVCVKNGYDAATRTVLVTGNSGMDRIDIPDSPTTADAARAAGFLLGDWLGDMPFRDQASRANALALVLTPFIRGLVPLVPLAAVSGLQMGVGKGLLGDCLAVLATGQHGVPLPYVTDDEDEIRKQILSAFRSGTDLFCFDEAHVIGGTSLARALTSITYTDRVLGVSKMASFPNQVTWMSLGNQVQVNADMSRRTYFIELHPPGPDPQDRPESAFVHPDLRSWTADSRPELVTAVLVLARAWFAAGCPPYHRGSLMGSFEAWDKTVSGILAYAGVEGFLGNLADKRSETDFSGGYWGEHLTWLQASFGRNPFTALEVKTAAQASSGMWDAPPGLDDLMDRSFARKLGQAYARVQDRWFGHRRLFKISKGYGNVVKWSVWVAEEDTQPDLGEGQQRGDIQKEGTGVRGVRGVTENNLRANVRAGVREDTHTCSTRGGGTPLVTPVPPQVSFSQVSLGFDLETADASALFTYPSDDKTPGQVEDGLAETPPSSFVRLGGIIGPSGLPIITSTSVLLDMLGAATEITGHNILGFDLLALAWHHGADWEALAAKARDTELIARQVWPPKSKEKHSEDKLGLDNVAELLGLPGKTDDLKRLKAKHGGYDKIPLDDPEYRVYLEGDLHATAAVSARLREYYDTDPYLPREHQVAAINGRMSLNGFRVDQDLLRQRLEEGAGRKGQALQALHHGWGLPLGKMKSHGRGSAKHEVFEEAISPLSTDYGRAWLEKQWERYQVPHPPRTVKTGKLALGAEDLKPILDDPRTPADLRAMLTMMAVVTTTRTIYQTTQSCLCADGKVHPFVSMRQSSGRSSVTNPGLTVFGKHGGRHVERDILIPDPGFVLMSFDLSQVDMRAIAGHCQDPAYMALFEPGRDAHAEIAVRVFGDPHGGHCPKGCQMRQDAKSRGHGWNYGMGPDRMIRDGVPEDVAYAFDNGMKQEFPVLCSWREGVRQRAKDGQILDNGFGRHMLADPQFAHTVGPALMGQGTAADILKQWILRCPRELDQYRMVTVHDEQVFQFPEADWQEMSRAVVRAAEGDFMGVPILCDQSGPGKSWGEISAK